MPASPIAPWKRAAAFLAVAGATAACFAPTLGHQFLIWDDAGYVWENPHLARSGADFVLGAFSEGWCNAWQPLTWLSLKLDHACWGLDPFGYHLGNVLLHALGAGALLLLALDLLAPRLPARLALGGAAAAALLWSLHPLRVESVAWVTERKDVLSVLLALLATRAWLRHAAACAAPLADDEDPSPVPGPRAAPWLWAALGLFALSLMAKPALVALPLAWLLVDWAVLQRTATREVGWLVLEKAPFLAASLLGGLQAAEAVRPQSVSFAEVGLPARLLNAVHALGTYLRLTVAPVRVSPFYPHPGDATAVTAGHLAALAALAAVTATAWLLRRRAPALLAAWLAFLLLLAPMLGLQQAGPQGMAARFTHGPSVALALLAGGAVAWGAAALARRRAWAGGAPLLVAVVAALALGAVTVRDAGAWRDDVTLWSRVIDLDPEGSARAWLERSNGQVRRGDLAAALADLDRALAVGARRGDVKASDLRQARALVLEAMAGRQAAPAP